MMPEPISTVGPPAVIASTLAIAQALGVDVGSLVWGFVGGLIALYLATAVRHEVLPPTVILLLLTVSTATSAAGTQLVHDLLADRLWFREKTRMDAFISLLLGVTAPAAWPVVVAGTPEWIRRFMRGLIDLAVKTTSKEDRK